MSRNRATLISLTVCAALALAATAPASSRGGAASEVQAAVASEAILYTPDAGFALMTTQVDEGMARAAEQHSANIATWNAAVEAEEERVRAAEAEAATIRAAQATPPPVKDMIRVAGPCGGWESLIAAHFASDQVAVACRVMMCESGGDPTIHNRNSSASGLWQFLDSTWENTTGTPGPAANYSPDVQTAAAAKLHASSGWHPWSCY